MEEEQFEHEEPCDEPLETAAPPTLLKALNHIMGPVLDREHGSLLYNVTNCRNIDPGAVLLFWYAFELAKRRGRRARIFGRGELIAELAEHFSHYRGDQPDDASTTSRGLYPLRSIQNEESMLAELDEWSRSVQEGTTASPEQVALWQMQIAEVTTNAFQHGPMHKKRETMPASIVAGKASGQCAQLAALDFGSTIPRVICEVASKHGISGGDDSLIEFACGKGITSRSVRQNQGAGLYSLVQTVHENGGTLQILSRNGLVHFCSGQVYGECLPCRHDGAPALDGTLTVINLRI
ncbi:MAG TPA: hypothetical protein VNH11_31525 [Pirellulales bacterium]|nr:hypothetical protein [Pirellulales bacterium]